MNKFNIRKIIKNELNIVFGNIFDKISSIENRNFNQERINKHKETKYNDIWCLPAILTNLEEFGVQNVIQEKLSGETLSSKRKEAFEIEDSYEDVV